MKPCFEQACSAFSPSYIVFIYYFYKKQVISGEPCALSSFVLTACCRLFFSLFIVSTPIAIRRSRKEMFQPHLPVRLPCYDLAPITNFTLGRILPQTSGTLGFHGLTGGVYKARERIHRAMADARLLANPASRSRVADSDPNWDMVLRFPPHHCVDPFCPCHCNTCVAPDVRAVLI